MDHNCLRPCSPEKKLRQKVALVLAALDTKIEPRADSPGYRNVPRADSPGYKNVPRADSPEYINVPRADSLYYKKGNIGLEALDTLLFLGLTA